MAKQSVHTIGLSLDQFQILAECHHEYQLRHRRFVSFPSLVTGILRDLPSTDQAEHLREGAIGRERGGQVAKVTLRLIEDDQRLFVLFRAQCEKVVGRELTIGAVLALLAFCYLKAVSA